MTSVEVGQGVNFPSTVARSRSRAHRRRLLRAVGVLPVLGLLLAFAPASRAAPATASEWFAYDRPATYDSHKTADVHVPMRDGTYLSCDLYRPARGQSPAPGSFPAIVDEYTPYGKNVGRRDYLAKDVAYFVRRGYVLLACDVRASGDSPGDSFFPITPQENIDNYDVIEWLASQPFTTGKIAQIGGSYGGFTSYRVASLQPPHLVTIVPARAYASMYMEALYPGGIEGPSSFAWADYEATVNPGRADADAMKAQWRAHPLYDDFWQQWDITRRYQRIKVPVLGYGGWYDVFKPGMIENYQGLRDHAWLVMGPWLHEPYDSASFAPAGYGATLAWLDRRLLGLKSAPRPRARVTSFEMPRSGGRGWQQFPDWPPPGAAPVRLALRSDGGLAPRPGPAGTRSYVVNPFDGPAVGDFSDELGAEHPAHDQQAADVQRLTYTSAPLSRDVVVAGPVNVRLRAALSAADGNLVVKLEDVTPDGRSRQATVGYLKASHRLSHERTTPIVSGQLTDFDIEVWPTHWRFQAGHRLRIAITSGAVPAIVTDAPMGTVSVASGRGGSYADVMFQHPRNAGRALARSR